MLVSLTFLTLIQSVGTGRTFWLYAALCVLAWIFVYLFVPETKNCSLEQIENNLRLGRPSRELGFPSHIPHTFVKSKRLSFFSLIKIRR